MGTGIVAMERDTLRVLQVWAQQGWYPVPWRHHPPEIRDLIRALRFRPQLKQCYSNCQKLILGNIKLKFGLALEYREGWIQVRQVPVPHAWLLFRGEVLDPTIPPSSNPVQYLESVVVTPAEIMASVVTTGMFQAVSPNIERAKIGPHWKSPQQQHP